jgi:hypothetical protein
MECPHEGCTCQGGEFEQFCSEHCRDHTEHTEEVPCDCGHFVCAGSAGETP